MELSTWDSTRYCTILYKVTYGSLCGPLTALDYSINTEDRCVFNRLRTTDYYLIRSKNKWDIDKAVNTLESLNRGELQNNIGRVFDLLALWKSLWLWSTTWRSCRHARKLSSMHLNLRTTTYYFIPRIMMKYWMSNIDPNFMQLSRGYFISVNEENQTSC